MDTWLRFIYNMIHMAISKADKGCLNHVIAVIHTMHACTYA